MDTSVLMNHFPVPLRYIATALLSIILVSIGLSNLRDRAAWVEPTDGVFWIESEGTLIAATIEAEGPGSHAGIRTGYRLLSVNEQPFSNLGQYSDFIGRLRPGVSLNYKLATDAGSRSVTIRLGSRILFGAKDWLRAILAFLHLGIGSFVLFRSDRLPRTHHFYLLCLAAFVVYLFSWTTKFGALDWWVYGLSIVAFLLLPALFVHFCLRFPVDAPISGKLTPLVYVPAFLLGMTYLLWATGHLAPLALPRTARSSELLDHIQLAYFSAGFVIGGVLLLKRRIEAHDLMVRQQMKWISYGTLAGIIPFSLIYILPSLLGVRANFAMEASMLSLGLIPLTFGYALIHYRLLDVEAIARRSAAYFIASSLLLSLYLLFVLVLGKALQWVAPQADFWAICIAVVAIAFLFAPLRNAIQARLDRFFYRDQFEHRSTLLDFARTLSSEISLIPLSRSILDRISKTFQISKAAIFLSDPVHTGSFRLVDSLRPESSPPAALYREDDLIGAQNSVVSIASKSGAGSLYAAGAALVQDGLFYLQDLRVHGRRVGLIALGQLPEDRHFSTEDLDLLTVLAGYAAMALENASLYRSVETKALELARLKAYTENIIESINVAVLALDLSGRITSCNRAFENLYDTTRLQMIGSPVEKLLQADLITSIQKAAGKQGWEISAPVNIFKQSLENPHGKRMIVNLSLIPMQDPKAGNAGALLVMDDISEKVHLEDQLLQAEKLSSIGLLAAGIAHEVNTPIAGISSYTQMLLKETPETDRRKKILEKIEKQTFRAAEIVSGLLNFSRLNSSEFKDLDINQLIEDSLALLNNHLQSNNIRVDSRYDLSLPPVYGNMGKLQQVFVNLFLNARDAMPSGGELAVQTGMLESMVVVDISDTGSGITEENIRRIFDPFFTTKSIGKGTGLGLAVSYGIVQEHGGGIFVDSSSGSGTHFRVKLPIRLH
jgi:two-component system NtrC family sensor kinase